MTLTSDQVKETIDRALSPVLSTHEIAKRNGEDVDETREKLKEMESDDEIFVWRLSEHTLGWSIKEIELENYNTDIVDELEAELDEITEG